MPTTIDIPRAAYAHFRREWDGPAADREGLTNPDEDTTRLEWDAELTPAQAERVADIGASAAASITPDEWAVIKPAISRLRDYRQLDTPTQAQTERAVKDLWRIVRALVRD